MKKAPGISARCYQLFNMYRRIIPIKIIDLFIQFEALACKFRSFIRENESIMFFINDIPIVKAGL